MSIAVSCLRVFVSPSVETFPYLPSEQVNPRAGKVLRNSVIKHLRLLTVPCHGRIECCTYFSQTFLGKYSLSTVAEQDMLGCYLVWPERTDSCWFHPCYHCVIGEIPVRHDIERHVQYRLACVPVSAVRRPQPEKGVIRSPPWHRKRHDFVLVHDRIIKLYSLIRTHIAQSCFSCIPRRVCDDNAILSHIGIPLKHDIYPSAGRGKGTV